MDAEHKTLLQTLNALSSIVRSDSDSIDSFREVTSFVPASMHATAQQVYHSGRYHAAKPFHEQLIAMLCFQTVAAKCTGTWCV